jgi:hypothetical protein
MWFLIWHWTTFSSLYDTMSKIGKSLFSTSNLSRLAKSNPLLQIPVVGTLNYWIPVQIKPQILFFIEKNKTSNCTLPDCSGPHVISIFYLYPLSLRCAVEHQQLPDASSPPMLLISRWNARTVSAAGVLAASGWVEWRSSSSPNEMMGKLVRRPDMREVATCVLAMLAA